MLMPPSWSWAAWAGDIYWPVNILRSHTPLCHWRCLCVKSRQWFNVGSVAQESNNNAPQASELEVSQKMTQSLILRAGVTHILPGRVPRVFATVKEFSSHSMKVCFTPRRRSNKPFYLSITMCQLPDERCQVSEDIELVALSSHGDSLNVLYIGRKNGLAYRKGLCSDICKDKWDTLDHDEVTIFLA